ncbi:hypothetical protein BH24ACT5_BH24ACT5_17110 [soil metagenome]
MRRRAAFLVVLVGVFVVVLLVRVAGSSIDFWNGSDTYEGGPDTEQLGSDGPLVGRLGAGPVVEPHEPRSLGDHIASTLDRWLAVGFLTLVGAALLWFLVTRRRRPQSDADDLAEPLFDVPRELAATADHLGPLLRQGSPRNAIVACWVALEAAVERSGLAHHPAETSTELTTRVLAHYSVDQHAIDELAALYREARFSLHELGEHDRDLAASALDELAVQLKRGVAAPTA